MVWRAEGFSSGPRLAAPSLRACAIVQSSARYKSTCSKSSTSTPLSVWQLMQGILLQKSAPCGFRQTIVAHLRIPT